ncbi:unnamed protein product [Nezara viridula]|uniref:BRCT domain-containing protein n=1 Tax=Nezara viridula TaxID=85310 RepID=A0A9P0H0T0_NEZVI|nr:unnamed protein product [Nezara viridula]
MLLVLVSLYFIVYILILKMVSTLVCSWSNEDWGNISGKCEEKSDSETCSTMEDSYGIDKPVVISNEHIALPDILQQSKDSEDILTKFLGTTSKEAQSDDNSEEIFSSHKNRNIKADLNRRNIVDKVFEKYDDPYMKFPVTKTPKTPGPRTPRHTLVSPTKTPASKPWKYVTLEERELRRRAAIEGQRDFCQVLIKKGIDPEEYVSSVFKSTKKSGSSKKFNFECSTPKTDTFSECVTTPFTDKSNVNTPISGIKKLPNYCGETSYTPNYLNCSYTSRCSDLSLNETFSPVHDLPPATKSTLLSGIICYVDVRSANEDMTGSVQEELLTLGARIEKNFTKKVTHVVFKEGRVSTYLKAKKEGVPLVSVLWIEACKRVRGVADPALHPPRRMEKYENILPFQTLKKRRLKFFNPNSKIRKNILENYNDPTFVPTLNGKRLATKKAATVCKDKVTNTSEDKENNGIRKFCTKKLLFNKCEDLFTDEKVEEENHIKITEKEVSADDSSIDSMPDIKSAVLRRKSAPAKIIFKKPSKPKVIEATEKEDILVISDDEIENIKEISKTQDQSIANNEPAKDPDEIVKLDLAFPQPSKKKRKLYDPEEVYVSLDEGQVTQESIVNTPVKRPRTKATASRQLVKLALARKRGNNKIKTDPDDDDCGSSPSTFVDDKANVSHRNKKHKERRSIVFTSVHRSRVLEAPGSPLSRSDNLVTAYYNK